MTQVPIHNVGRVGIIQDTPSHLLPPEAWSDGRNVEFLDNKAKKTEGFSLIYDPPTVAPHWLMPIFTGVSRVWLYTSLTKAYVISGAVHTNITRISGDYTGAIPDRWHGSVLGGIPVINNGIDDPQVWDPQTIGTPLVDLPNWPVATSAKIIRPFKNYLVALDVTKSGTRFPHMVKWSHVADPGSVPVTWDETDPTKDAGETQLGDTNQGPMVDQLPLGDTNIIYKEDSVWGMQFIGGRFIFRFLRLFPEQIGLMAQGAVGVVPRQSLHFLATPDDILIHNGQNPRSVLNKRLKRWLTNILSSTQSAKSYVTIDRVAGQMWFCFAEEGATWPNLALTWEWESGALGIRELTDAAFINTGPTPDLSADTWDSDLEVWDSDPTSWDFATGRPTDKLLLQADPVATKLYRHNDTNTFNGTNPTAYLERTGLAIIGIDREGNPRVDVGRRKLITRIWPKMRGGPVNVRLGSQELIDGPITWVGPVAFDPSTEKYVDIVNQGLFMAVRFESTANVFWELDGYDIEVVPLGQF